MVGRGIHTWMIIQCSWSTSTHLVVKPTHIIWGGKGPMSKQVIVFLYTRPSLSVHRLCMGERPLESFRWVRLSKHRQLFEWPWPPSKSHAESPHPLLSGSFFWTEKQRQLFLGRKPICHHGHLGARKPAFDSIKANECDLLAQLQEWFWTVDFNNVTKLERS